MPPSRQGYPWLFLYWNRAGWHNRVISFESIKKTGSANIENSAPYSISRWSIHMCAQYAQLATKLRKYNSWSVQFKHHTDASNVKHCDLAESIHISAAAFSQYRAGKRLPHFSIAYSLSKALNLSPEAKDIFLQAWFDTKMIRECIDTIETALRNKDFASINTILALLSEDAQRLLSDDPWFALWLTWKSQYTRTGFFLADR